MKAALLFACVCALLAVQVTAYDLFHLGTPIDDSTTASTGLTKKCAELQKLKTEKYPKDLDTSFIWFQGLTAGYLHGVSQFNTNNAVVADVLTDFKINNCKVLSPTTANWQPGNRRESVKDFLDDAEKKVANCVLKLTEPGVVGISPCYLKGLTANLKKQQTYSKWRNIWSGLLLLPLFAFLLQSMQINFLCPTMFCFSDELIKKNHNEFWGSMKLKSLSFCDNPAIVEADFTARQGEKDVNLLNVIPKTAQEGVEKFDLLILRYILHMQQTVNVNPQPTFHAFVETKEHHSEPSPLRANH
jgi:hypothetical protein